jgi:glycosyltransferase involved in cell wall biosynthesis
MDVVVVTMIPSPYQVELFNAIAASGRLSLSAVYLQEKDPGRQWSRRERSHEAHVATDDLDASIRRVREADLAVISCYRGSTARTLIKARDQEGTPWAFWGERPGFTVDGWIGRLFRRVALHRLHASPAPIWGIGSWAVEGYREEFGADRSYFNVPYFSNLRRFQKAVDTSGAVVSSNPQHDTGPSAGHSADRAGQSRQTIRLLYSGSLSERKGVDLLARAFADVAPAYPHLTLDVAGDGPLREMMETTLSPVRDRVTFHGFVGWDVLPDLYARADVLCAPSRYDGWGLIVPEGLAAGLPVVGTEQMGAAIDLITPGETGWRIPADDRTALRDTLQRVAELSSDSLTSMSRDAQEKILNDHMIENGVKVFADAAEASVRDFNAAA